MPRSAGRKDCRGADAYFVRSLSAYSDPFFVSIGRRCSGYIRVANDEWLYGIMSTFSEGRKAGIRLIVTSGMEGRNDEWANIQFSLHTHELLSTLARQFISLRRKLGWRRDQFCVVQ